MDETKAIREALTDYSGDDATRTAGLAALDALEARLKALEETAAADSYACCAVLSWEGMWPLGVQKLRPSRHVTAVLERLETAERKVGAL